MTDSLRDVLAREAVEAEERAEAEERGDVAPLPGQRARTRPDGVTHLIKLRCTTCDHSPDWHRFDDDRLTEFADTPWDQRPFRCLGPGLAGCVVACPNFTGPVFRPAVDLTASTGPNLLAGIPCRRCGQPALRIELRMESRPIGSFSLSGNTATEWPWAVCDSCGGESRGREVTP